MLITNAANIAKNISDETAVNTLSTINRTPLT